MNLIDQKLRRIASLYLGFKNVRIAEQRTWNLWIGNLEASLEIIKELLTIDELSYSEMVSLDRMITLLLELPSDYKIVFNPNSHKQNKVIKILDDIRKEQTILKNRQKEYQNSRKEYKDLDEWIIEQNILMLEQPKSRHDSDFSLSKEKYSSEYSLFMDIRSVILTSKSSNSNRIYILDTITEIEDKLILDIQAGKIVTSESVTELLSIARLTKNNLPLQQTLLLLRDESNLRKKIAREINEKTLKYYYDRY